MRKMFLALSLVAALAIPALAHGTSYVPQGTVAKQACKDERSNDADAFKVKYANNEGKHAFRRCVRQHRRHARKKCRAERKADKQAFKQKYGDPTQNYDDAYIRCQFEHEDDPVEQHPEPEPANS
jgi:uncharacterized membrane protein